MKILHIISGGDSGGAKTHMFALLDELCKIADTTVICLMHGVFYDEILTRNVRTILLEQKNRMDLSVCKPIEELVLREHFDIINTHGARANFVATFLRPRVLDIPIVTTIHSDYLLDFDTPWKKLVFTTLNTIALKKIRYKIAVSDSFRDMLISRGFCPNDILTVYNGMDFNTPVHPAAKQEFARRYAIPYDPEKVYIGIAARFNRVKGVDIFLRAAAEVLRHTDSARFVIIGDGDEADALKALACSLGISDQVYFLGFVHEIYDFYNFIDINTLTSLSESFPYSLLEGARLEKPTVAAAVGGVPHLIVENQTGLLFEPKDHQDCAEKLLSLIQDREKAQRLGRALYNYAIETFSNRALAEAYLHNYKRFIEKYHRETRYDVILSGYYGFGNLGDDIVLETLISELKSRRPDIELLALTKKPRQAASRFGIDCKNRFHFGSVRRSFRQSRVYLNGGGSLLTDATSKRSLAYYASLLVYAKKQGLSTILLSNGIGPLRHKYSIQKAQQALQCTDLVTLRDQDSLALAQRLGRDQNTFISADLAFLFRPDPSRAYQIHKQYLKYTLDRGRYAVVCLRSWWDNAPGFTQIIAAGCDYLFRQYGLTAVFLPVQPDKDRSIAQETLARMTAHGVVLTEALDNTNLLYSWISGARLCISMRLHPLICAFSSDTPLLGIVYDKKVSEFLKEIQTETRLDAKTIRTDSFCAALDSVMRLSVPAEQNAKLLADMKRSADRSITLALEQFPEN